MKRALSSVAALLLLAACPGHEPKDASQSAPPKTTTTTQSPQAVPENSTAMIPVTSTAMRASASPTVDVQLLEYEIRMPDTLNAGPQRLRVANGGHESHSLAIEGPGLSTQLGSNLTRGDTTELEVTLQPGTYRVWCPVDKHRGKGMERTLTVK